MITWEIDFQMIAHGNPEAKAILMGWGAQGWEPYAIVGVTHYFRRAVGGAEYMAIAAEPTPEEKTNPAEKINTPAKNKRGANK